MPRANRHRRACRTNATRRVGYDTYAVLLAAGLSCGAHAQQVPSVGPLEEVQVTGSRIQRSGMTTPTPVTAVSAEELINLAPGTLMDAMTQLPQFLANDTPESTAGWTGSAGQSLLNLRGIGSVRTLVLLDGRRIVPSTRRGTTDISIFPQALLNRTEVVTGGASAAYGSDAVSGVVNFILDTDFDGVDARVQGGISDRGDGQTVLASLTGGTAIGSRGHLVAAFEHYGAEEVRAGHGDHGSGSRHWIEENWGTIVLPGQPPGQQHRVIVPNVRSTLATFGGIIKGGPMNNIQFMADGQPTRFFPGELVNNTGQAQVGGSGDIHHSTLMPEQTRDTAFLHYKHDLGANLEWYVQGLWGQSKVEYDKETHHFNQGYPGTIQIYADNAFLPTSIRQRMIDEGLESFTFAKTHTRSEGIPARTITTNTTTSFTTGLNGEFGDGWSYNVYYQWGQNRQDLNHRNNMRTDLYFRAIDSVFHPTSGEIVCMSTLTNPNDGCIPFNPFGIGNASDAAWASVVDEQSQMQYLRQDVVEATVSGAPLDGWAGPIAMAFGASYRNDKLDQFPRRPNIPAVDCPVPIPETVGYRNGSIPASYFDAANCFSYGGIPVVRGSFDVWEVFQETILPLAEPLDLNASVRYADYEGSGGIWAWKAGLDWRVTDSVRLRLTRSRDVRAGTLSERLATTGRGGSVFDRFLPGEPSVTIVSQEGANATIDPEKADTLTFGIVWQPSLLQGFNMSVDYYDIEITDAIDLLGNQLIMDGCWEATQLGNVSPLCDLIIRRDGPGTPVTTIHNTYLNIAEARTTGVDLEVTQQLPIGLRIRGLVSYIEEASITNPGSPKIDRAGQNSIAPEWNGLVSLTYNRGPFSGTWTQRYISSGIRNALWMPGRDYDAAGDANHVPARAYTNLRASYAADTYEVYANITNLFDRAPPPVVGGSLYSDMGRAYAVGVRFSY